MLHPCSKVLLSADSQRDKIEQKGSVHGSFSRNTQFRGDKEEETGDFNVCFKTTATTTNPPEITTTPPNLDEPSNSRSYNPPPYAGHSTVGFTASTTSRGDHRVVFEPPPV